ncbi:hypothetical protein PCANC_03680 [Puccinia coronata f. sp. avenae]|uniref:Uncharacterized protein n=1 Tax=Puccinia coronata f. sp. avenae TaxID=200324 RepID=A0A2N5V8A3_9BASI|nr:hypothetical protein PCASD_20723 [Puccinia coronata f. sp. avenae]PLW21202.1 hypothetical protein PCANC_05426 [Puccinia coronata f. sp. avenae]PLW46231.1 hypothetical protein PCASD_03764 [Puccinia coronata f. sp. avenae]PLW54738.1 hypothetical protein PCANC_03680 [Puccinia coronata f. sp. avenae]
MSIGRGLLVRLPGQLQQQHIRTLEASYEAASQRFGSYNFREYFARKARQKFDEQLPRVLGCTNKKNNNNHHKVDDELLSRANMSTDQRARLLAWWQASLDELAVLERASIMNRLFEAPKLVVEQAPTAARSPKPIR